MTTKIPRTTLHNYETDEDRDITVEQARKFIREHTDGIELVRRVTSWQGPFLSYPEKFKVLIHITFSTHSLCASFDGVGVNITRGTVRSGGVPVDNWPLEYEVASDEADAFYQAALAEQEAARG